MASRSQILTTRGVHEVSAALHLGDKLVVKEVLGFGVERRVDGYNVADLDHVLDIGVPDKIQFLLHGLRQPMSIVIMQVHIERFEAT